MTAGFRRYAWFFAAYLIAVILFGAWVRISGSGNGCGNHWPMCNGEVMPRAPETKTIIEFTHRLTSGACGILGLVLLWRARRAGRAVFHAALATMFFLIVESLIGAVLVKKELVAGNASLSRALVVSLHLANTMLLVASAATTAWWAGERAVERGRLSVSKAMIAVCVVALVATNMTGAVTALGDTLFPAKPALDGGLMAKLANDLSASQHFLVRLRVIHPVVAVVSAALVLMLFHGLYRQTPGATLGKLLEAGQVAVLAQVCLGALNVALAAPGWMQIVHLLAAQVVWVLMWLVTLSVWNPVARTLSVSQALPASAR